MPDDIRAAMAREAHRKAWATREDFDRYRKERDELVRALRADNPGWWTYDRLANAVGCSPELIAHIVKRA